MLIRNTNDRNLGDARKTLQRTLVFCRLDMFRARHNHVIEAIMNEQIAFEISGIAGMEPAIFYRRIIGTIPVCIHYLYAGDDDFSNITELQQSFPSLLDDAEFCSRDRFATGLHIFVVEVIVRS